MKSQAYDHIKRFVNSSSLTSAILNVNAAYETNDLINNIWIDFFESKKDETFNEQNNLSFKTYIYNHCRWALLDIFRLEVSRNIFVRIGDIDIVDERSNIENMEIEKELSTYGDELLLYYQGFSQQAIADLVGITKQAINKRIQKQIKKYID